MIDLENVLSRGLRGAQYLQNNDYVDIFYSQSCCRLEQEFFENIITSNAEFHIYKLKNASKNALDFYIASHIGEVYGSGYQGNIAIVSNDKGYKAVRDFWSTYSGRKNQIILGADIQRCILQSNEDSERRMSIKQALTNIDLETEYARYEERQKMKRQMEKVLAGTEYEELAGNVFDIIGREKSKKIIYLDMLKKFGRKSGTEIYNKIKQVC